MRQGRPLASLGFLSRSRLKRPMVFGITPLQQGLPTKSGRMPEEWMPCPKPWQRGSFVQEGMGVTPKVRKWAGFPPSQSGEGGFWSQNGAAAPRPCVDICRSHGHSTFILTDSSSSIPPAGLCVPRMHCCVSLISVAPVVLVPSVD